MVGCMFKVVLKNGCDGWLYVQSCFNAMQDSKWMGVCSMLY